MGNMACQPLDRRVNVEVTNMGTPAMAIVKIPLAKVVLAKIESPLDQYSLYKVAIENMSAQLNAKLKELSQMHGFILEFQAKRDDLQN
jgi:hypothetical protein